MTILGLCRSEKYLELLLIVYAWCEVVLVA